MSKSLRNYPDPNVVINKYGADATRFVHDDPHVHLQSADSPEQNVFSKFAYRPRGQLTI